MRGAASGPPAKDPGVRTASAGAGAPLSTLSADELTYFLQDGLSRFIALDSVDGTIPGETDSGLGPTYNSNSCGSCHAQPAIGGTSPSTNPQIAAATADGAANWIQELLSASRPVREVRFPMLVNSNGSLSRTADGGVHDLFTITGRGEAAGCEMEQPNFAQMQRMENLIFRIPTPLFGAGLMRTFRTPRSMPTWPRTPNSSRAWKFGPSQHQR